MAELNKRADHGAHRVPYNKNRKIILATQDTCALCGKLVDKTLKPPHPLAPQIDHIIPVSRGGHPSDLNNLQLAHATCNRAKSDKLKLNNDVKEEVVSNRNLPQLIDWKAYRSK